MPIEFNVIPRLCLNMIVKNESKIIRRLLESVAPIIDAYCICDTGSTDDTVTIIEDFFMSKGIPGKIPREPFRDFAHNRSFALKQCESMPVDYILLLDADMVFVLGSGVTPVDFKRGLAHDAYHMFQGTDTFYYKNARLVKNRIGASYWGVTHEYLKTPDGSSYGLIDKPRAFINDIGDGGSKADKFERDIRLLLKGLEDNPNNDRYTFYLANSYRDHGDHDLAIEYYKKRIEIGGWHEEVWHSYYSIGKCYKAKGDAVNAVHWWMEAYQFFPKRIENLYEIVSHYRQIGKNQLAYMYYIIAPKQTLLYPNPDYLFLQRDVYDYKLDYEFSIIGYYCNIDKYDMTRICTKVLNCKNSEWNIVRNVMSNYKFYSKKLADYADEFPEKLRCALRNVGLDLVAGEPDAEHFVSSTPSLAFVGDDELVVNVRYVNYRINDRGGYDNQEHIATKNVIARFRLNSIGFTEENSKSENARSSHLFSFKTPPSGEECAADCPFSYETSYVSFSGESYNSGAKNERRNCPSLMRNGVNPSADYEFEKISEDFMWYDTELDNLYVGLEDVRLFYSGQQNRLLYNANRGLGAHNIKVETGHAFSYAHSSLRNCPETVKHNSGIIRMDGEREVEKNWVMFEDAYGNLKMIYNWHDLVVGDCVQNTDGGYTFTKTHKIRTPPIFKYFRGSTNGVLIGDEIWFICHTVSYEDRRYYYHSILTLDAKTYEVRRFTPLFTFEGDKVEYTLGFVYIGFKDFEYEDSRCEFGASNPDGTFWIGYSKMDSATHYMAIRKSVVEGMMTS